MKRFALAALIITLGNVSAASKEENLAREKTAWDQEMEKLKREKPSEYEAFRTTLTSLTELSLARMGYSVGAIDGNLDKQSLESLQLYQKNRKLLISEDPLAYETFNQIQTDINAIDTKPIGLPSSFVYTDDWDSGFFSASGTWMMTGGVASPEQTSEIKCWRERGICVQAQAEISHLNSNPFLGVSFETIQIERWDNVEIVTKPMDFFCMRYVYRVNRIQKSVSGIRTTISKDKQCENYDQSDKYLTLADGGKVWQKLLDQHNEKIKQIMAPAFLEKTGLLLKQIGKN